MNDLIYRQAAIDELERGKDKTAKGDLGGFYNTIVQNDINKLRKLQSAQPERMKGKWTEKHHAYSDEEFAIEEWQSCRCSECGHYDTRPYLYYFSEPNYCSYCGADMRERRTDETN